MPLLDHFHPPLHPRRRWESFHAGWIGTITDALNDDLLPDGYFAEQEVHHGPRIEIDVATYADHPPEEPAGGTATVVYAPPVPALEWPAATPDEFVARVFGDNGERRLVAAVELVSPGNKDRPEARRAFAAKCAAYLAQDVSLVVVDVVTERGGNLHAEIAAVLGLAETGMSSGVGLYAVAYRPIVRDDAKRIAVWPEPLALGAGLPTLPLALSAGLCVPIDLEATYALACQRKRIP